MKILKGYILDQNNSGGVFESTQHLYQEDKVYPLSYWGDYFNLAIIDKKDLPSDIYFNGCDKGIDCECCGDRWDNDDLIDKKEFIIFDTLKEYNEHPNKDEIYHYCIIETLITQGCN